MTNTSIKIPLWINIYGTAIFLFGLSLSIACYFDIHYFLKAFSLVTPDDAKGASLLTGRILVQAILMLVGLFSQNPKFLLLAFIQRFITEMLDCYAEMKYGTSFPPSFVLALISSALLLPEFIIIRKLLQIDGRSNY